MNGEHHKVTGPAKNVAGRAHSAAGTRDCCEISGHSVDGLPHSVPHCAAPTVLARNFSAWPNPERDVVGRVAPRAPPGHRPPRNGAHGVTRPTLAPVLRWIALTQTGAKGYLRPVDTEYQQALAKDCHYPFGPTNVGLLLCYA